VTLARGERDGNGSIFRFAIVKRPGRVPLPDVKRAPQFGKAALAEMLATHAIEYVFLGRELGGRPDAPEFYREGGAVDYERRAQAADFKAGVERLLANRRARFEGEYPSPSITHFYFFASISTSMVVSDARQIVVQRVPFQVDRFEDEAGGARDGDHRQQRSTLAARAPGAGRA
jgi:hypothetical protein